MAGLTAGQQFSSLPAFPSIVLLGIACGLLWVGRLKIPAAFLFGLAWALGFAAFRLHDALPEALERRDMTVEGEVLDVPDELDEGWRFGFRVDRVSAPAGVKTPQKIRLSWFNTGVRLKAGERWRLRVRLKRPHGFLNPGGMDYELWLFSQNIRATGYVREDAENRRVSESATFSPRAWRQSVFDKLESALRGREMAGIVTALTMGEENAISPQQWEVLRRTGTAHLVAISGSHISLVAGLVYFLARWAASRSGVMRFSPQTIAAAAACIAALLYSALADFAIPTQRALIMIFIVMAGIMAQRNVRPLPTLALALLAVTLYDPLAVLAAGFWLSYGAVALILLAVAGHLRPSGWWMELWRINWATSLGLAPLLLFFFQQVSLVSPVANLLAVPTIGFVLTPLCLIGALLLGLYPRFGEWILRVTEILLQQVWWLLQWLSDLHWAQWSHPAPPGWTLPFAVAGVLLLLAPRGIPARWLGMILLVPAISFQPEVPARGKFRLTLLDVGQGLAAVVQTHERTLVFDAGARMSRNFDAGSAVVEPFLRQQGVNRIDVLVVSHGDNDHIGGAASLLRRFPVGLLYTSVPSMLSGTPAEPCRNGESWTWDGVRFDMLSPFGTLGNENNNSCVLRVSSPAGSALLTGDIERAAERLLVEHYGVGLRTDILIAPHHGSNTSSSETFLAEVKPSYVLIPVGYLNRYNFPNADVMRRYHAIGAKVLDSATAGAITVEPGEFPPRAYRQTDGRYWNDKVGEAEGE